MIFFKEYILFLQIFSLNSRPNKMHALYLVCILMLLDIGFEVNGFRVQAPLIMTSKNMMKSLVVSAVLLPSTILLSPLNGNAAYTNPDAIELRRVLEQVHLLILEQGVPPFTMLPSL